MPRGAPALRCGLHMPNAWRRGALPRCARYTRAQPCRARRRRLNSSLAKLRCTIDRLARNNAALKARGANAAAALRHCDALVRLAALLQAAEPRGGGGAAGGSGEGPADGGGKGGGAGAEGGGGAAPPRAADLLASVRAALAAEAGAAGTDAAAAGADAGVRSPPGAPPPPLGWEPEAAAALYLSGGYGVTTASTRRLVLDFVRMASVQHA